MFSLVPIQCPVPAALVKAKELVLMLLAFQLQALLMFALHQQL